ncbi:EamA family transporter [candidate division FCPU426 bacterium]|nr:EamA family transporter [candidate division FCPU426 bacterium]
MEKYLYLLIIYIVWGTTYLAMRIGVAPDSGFPVFAFGGLRCLLAAIILLAMALIRSYGRPKPAAGGAGSFLRGIRLTYKEMLFLAFTGLTAWIGAHALVLWAEQYMASGFAAVAVSSAPIWVLLIDSIYDKVKPQMKHLIFVFMGFLGVGILVFPEMRRPAEHGLHSVLFLLLATLFWAFTSVLMKRRSLTLSSLTISGYQHLFGGLGFVVLSLFFKEPLPAPTPAAWLAFFFLLVLGSVVAFTSYIKALSLLPTQVVTTNAFVNPVIAVILGWLLLGEPLSIWTGGAVVLVAGAVSGVIFGARDNKYKNSKKRQTKTVESIKISPM